ncbi:MAG: KdsC family phosphatase [Phycisphaerae bacterium]|jgi:3-deoxy-D-manno-octulosonate 8-phosphate phosphatase (KDO 8-P phosphatase)
MLKNGYDMQRLQSIKLLILDVDGVLTDGSIIINNDGVESKKFNVLDGHGVKLWQRAGGRVAIISGRAVKVTGVRAEQLGIDYVYQGCTMKLPVFEQLLDTALVSGEEAAFIGDDVIDIPIAMRVGFSAAVANAVDELKERSDYITKKKGGEGAVREVVEYLLKHQGKWDTLMERYC